MHVQFQRPYILKEILTVVENSITGQTWKNQTNTGSQRKLSDKGLLNKNFGNEIYIEN